MKHENNPEDLQAQQWLDALLNAQPSSEEIGADHQAMDAAGLPPVHKPNVTSAEPVSGVPAWDSADAFESTELFRDDEFQNAFEKEMDLTQIIEEINAEALSETHQPPEAAQHFNSAADRQTRSPMTEPEAAVPQVKKAPTPQAVPAKPNAAQKNPAAKAPSAKPSSKKRARQDTAPTETKAEKGRPKRKNGYGILLGIPHLLSTALWLALIVAIGVTAGRMIWLCATDVLAFGREPITATVVIEETDTMEDVAVKLQNAGLIRYTGMFELYADLSNAQEKIRPGTYEFNPPSEDTEVVVYDYMALVSVMSPASGPVIVDDLRIPEGYTCAQIFQLLEDNNVCTVQELEDYAASGELDDYWFLDGVQRGDKYCLEGYLFPDTYDFYENDDPERVLEKMLDAFDRSITTQMRDDLNLLNTQLETMMSANGYDSSYIEANRITIREVVIIASMIEKETANNVESFTIASVIYNRLTNAAAYPYLNIDAALVYALGGKAELTEEDKKLDSPYNTYTYKGLPPGPISNPSQNSLAAALDPEMTDYYYYAYDPSAEEHHFSVTYEEHLQFLESLESRQTQEAVNE